jgi:hypothetical protein
VVAAVRIVSAIAAALAFLRLEIDMGILSACAVLRGRIVTATAAVPWNLFPLKYTIMQIGAGVHYPAFLYRCCPPNDLAGPGAAKSKQSYVFAAAGLLVLAILSK